jgi:tRNA A37 threonylcarbamoyladenosine modification protein TsaB
MALLPQAAAILELARPEVAAGRLLPAREALPVYLRDDVARPSFS